MTRREFFAALSAAFTLVPATMPVAEDMPALVPPDRLQHRVWLDGVEITERVRFAYVTMEPIEVDTSCWGEDRQWMETDARASVELDLIGVKGGWMPGADVLCEIACDHVWVSGRGVVRSVDVLSPLDGECHQRVWLDRLEPARSRR